MKRGRPRQWPSGRQYAIAQSERINRLTREIQRLLSGWRPVAYQPKKKTPASGASRGSQL